MSSLILISGLPESAEVETAKDAEIEEIFEEKHEEKFGPHPSACQHPKKPLRLKLHLQLSGTEVMGDSPEDELLEILYKDEFRA